MNEPTDPVLYGPDNKPVEKAQEPLDPLNRYLLNICVFCATPFGPKAASLSRRQTGRRSGMIPLRYGLDFQRKKFYFHGLCKDRMFEVIKESATNGGTERS